MKKKRLMVKDKKLQELLKKTERKNIKKDFLELLKRATQSIKD